MLATMVRAQGISLLFEPSDVKPELDIIFIHGFTGHPRLTWTLDKKKAEKRRKANNDAPSHNVHNGGQTADVYWPKDLVPITLPSARVMTFGYDTKIRHFSQGQISKNTVQDHARELLEQLRDKRPPDAKGSRPLVFIAHSLGGLVVREALTLAASQHQNDQASTSRYEDIFRSTVAIMFFGTPHRGADPRSSFHRLLSGSALRLGVDVNVHIVDALMPNVNNLQKQLSLDDFKTLAAQRGWIVYTFQEEYGVSSLFSRKVVEDHSSRLGPPVNETPRRISDNHMDMCRFYGVNDPEYEKVAACLQEIVKGVRHPTASQIRKLSPSLQTQTIRVTLEKLSSDNVRGNLLGKPPTQDNEQPRQLTAPIPVSAPTPATAPAIDLDNEAEKERRNLRWKLVQSLKFDQLGARFMNIEAALGNTCQWFLSRQEYINWQKPGRHSPSSWILWLKGKPGTGKSTLMKYLYSTRQTGRSRKIILSCFFNARGAQMERSTVGCLRALLFDLLDHREKLWPTLDYLGSVGSGYILEHSWTVYSLAETFTRAVQMVQDQAIEIWIDALDECEENEVRKMVSFFEDLAGLADIQNIDLKICFASRHYPSITSRRAVDVVLESQQHHDEDIARYIEARLHIGTAQTEEIKAELLRKCSGIFLWVVLVVDILNREYARGNVLALRKRLDEIPADLHSVYETILSKNDDGMEELLLFLQLLLSALRPLEPPELFVAVQRATETKAPIQRWDKGKPPMSTEDLHRWVNSTSRGLAQVTLPEKASTRRDPRRYGERIKNPIQTPPIVQFIHESVRDYLFGKSVKKYTWAGLSHFRNPEKTHEMWKNICMCYILAADLSTCSSILINWFEYKLTEYAVNSVIHHADRACKGGISQVEFLRQFPTYTWAYLWNAYQRNLYDIAIICGRGELNEYMNLELYETPPSLLYLFARFNASHLIQTHPKRSDQFRHEYKEHQSPWAVAVMNRNSQAIQELVNATVTDASAKLTLREAEYLTTNLAGACLSFFLRIGLPGTRQLDLRLGKWGEAAIHLSAYGHASLLESFLVQTAEKKCRCDFIEEPYIPEYPRYPHHLTANSPLEEMGTLFPTASPYPTTPLQEKFSASYAADNSFIARLRRGEFDYECTQCRSSNYGRCLPSRCSYVPQAQLSDSDDTGMTCRYRSSGRCLRAIYDYLNYRGVNGRTPFFYVREKAIAELLVSLGADPNAQDNYGQTALVKSIETGDIDALQALGTLRVVDLKLPPLDQPMDPEFRESPRRNRHDRGVHWDAFIKGKITTQHVDPTIKDMWGMTPLCLAAYVGKQHPHAMETLLTLWPDLDPNLPDIASRTPLHFAVKNGSKEAVERLVSHFPHLDPNIADDEGWTPLSWAAGYHIDAARPSPDMVRYLLAHCPSINPDKQDAEGKTPLRWALEAGRAYLYADGEKEAKKQGKRDMFEIPRLLLATKKVDPFQKAEDGLSPFDVLCELPGSLPEVWEGVEMDWDEETKSKWGEVKELMEGMRTAPKNS